MDRIYWYSLTRSAPVTGARHAGRAAASSTERADNGGRPRVCALHLGVNRQFDFFEQWSGCSMLNADGRPRFLGSRSPAAGQQRGLSTGA